VLRTALGSLLPRLAVLCPVLPACCLPAASEAAVTVRSPRPAIGVLPPFASGNARTPMSPIEPLPPFAREAEVRTELEVFGPGSGTP